MKIGALFILFILLTPFNIAAQGGTWLWVKGSDTARAAPVFGIQGVSDINNTHGSLWRAANLIDRHGNL